MSYLIIICPNSHEKFTTSVIILKWSSWIFAKTLVWPLKLPYYSVISPTSHVKMTKLKVAEVIISSSITRLTHMKPYPPTPPPPPLPPRPPPQLTWKLPKCKIRSSLFYWPLFGRNSTLLALVTNIYPYSILFANINPLFGYNCP